MDIEQELIEMADVVTRLINVATQSIQRKEGGSLTVIGTGIQSITQLTLEAIAEIRKAESLLHVIGEPRQEAVLRTLNPVAQSLTNYYSADTDRGVTYEAMIEHILQDVMSGKHTVAAFYGHPGVFVYPTHEAVRRTRAAGFPARMLPAISAEDCLVADLGIDPGDGFHAFEASDFLFRRQPIDPTVHLVIWQIGALGDYSGGAAGYDPNMFMRLVRKLGSRYGPAHPVTIYEAPFDPNDSPNILQAPIAQLMQMPVTLASTLYVPPIARLMMPGWMA